MSMAVRRRPIMLGQSSKRRHRPDYILVLIGLILSAVGLIVIYAISPGLSVQNHVGQNYFVNKQLISVGLGAVVFIVVASVPLKVWRHFQKPLIVIAALATLIALITPTSAEYPAHRWIRLGGFSLQSVEFVKFALLIGLAGFFVDRLRRGDIARSRTTQILLSLLAVIGLVVAIAQKDLGSAGVIVAIALGMGFIAGLPLKRFFLAGLVLLVAAVLLIVPFSYRRDRLSTFLNPSKDCTNTGYQACQALIAVGSGGIIGNGLASSGQAYGYLPEAENDSIFAIVAEKFGFIGVSTLIILFIVLFSRLKKIMERAPDNFSRLIVAGVLAWLSSQMLINIGAMIGLLPLKGITLPFVSYGGTSVVLIAAVIGLTFNISRYTTYSINTTEDRGEEYDDSVDRRRNRRPYYATVSRRP